MDLITNYAIVRPARRGVELPLLGYMLGALPQIGTFPAAIVDASLMPELRSLPTPDRVPARGGRWPVRVRVTAASVRGHAVRFSVEIGPPHDLAFSFRVCPCGELFQGFMTWACLQRAIVVAPLTPDEEAALQPGTSGASGLILPVNLGSLAHWLDGYERRMN